MESDEVKQKLLTEITNVSPVADLVGDSVVDQSDGIPPNKRVKTGGLAGVLERIRSEKKDGRMSATTQNVNSNQNTAVRVSNVSLLEDELVRYDALTEAEVDVDPLIWWKANAGSFKCLSILAKKYLCVAATSVASERVFSTSGNIVSAKRNRLSPETVDMLTFLAKNLD